jgi:hypothetical protein
LRNAATTVLSFGNVSEEALEKILKLSGDLAATGRGDLEQWATVLAKVGTAPAETLGLLERQFGKIDIATKVAIISAQQMGDVAKANALLFDLVALQGWRCRGRLLQGPRAAARWNPEGLDATSRRRSAKRSSARSRARRSCSSRRSRPVLVMMGLPTKAQFAQANAEAMKPGIDREIQALQNTIGAARASGGDTTDLERQLRAANSRKQQGLLSSAYAGAYDDQSSRASRQGQVLQGSPSAPASMFTPQGQLELQQQQLQAQQQLGDQSYQILQEQIQRELALNDKKHAAGPHERAGVLRAARRPAGTGGKRRGAAAPGSGRQAEGGRGKRSCAGRPRGDESDGPRRADSPPRRRFDAEKAKELQLEGQLAGAVAKTGTARKIVNADEARRRSPSANSAS